MPRDLYNDELPDLNEIPRERWSEVLRPLSDWSRRRAAARVTDPEAHHEALVLAGFMLCEDPPQETLAPEPSLPDAPSTDRPRTRQLSFRLSSDHYDRVAAVAASLGLSPTAFARLMVIRAADSVTRP